MNEKISCCEINLISSRPLAGLGNPGDKWTCPICGKGWECISEANGVVWEHSQLVQDLIEAAQEGAARLKTLGLARLSEKIQAAAQAVRAQRG